MKIPTVIGLLLISLTSLIGFGLYYYLNQQKTVQVTQTSPEEISVVNITDSSAAIIWKTEGKVNESIIYSQSNKFDNSFINFLPKQQEEKKDIRGEKISAKTHYVQLDNLTENTTYYFEIKSSSKYFPKTALSFKTITKKSGQNKPESEAIIGKVVNTRLEGVPDALIQLQIENAAPIAGFTSQDGNFIIPIQSLKTKDLQNDLVLKQKQTAMLIISNGEETSHITIVLPLKVKQLPTVILGQDADFSTIN